MQIQNSTANVEVDVLIQYGSTQLSSAQTAMVKIINGRSAPENAMAVVGEAIIYVALLLMRYRDVTNSNSTGPVCPRQNTLNS